MPLLTDTPPPLHLKRTALLTAQVAAKSSAVAFLDFTFVLYSMDMGPYLSAFIADAVPFIPLKWTADDGTSNMFSLLVQVSDPRRRARGGERGRETDTEREDYRADRHYCRRHDPSPIGNHAGATCALAKCPAVAPPRPVRPRRRGRCLRY